VNRLAKFARLSFGRKWLLVRCWLGLNLTAAALRVWSLRRILAVFRTNAPTPRVQPRFSREDILWSIRAAAALSWKPTCAVRGLVAERLLRKNGYPAQFRIGVLRQDEFQAHAWVEDQGTVLIGESELPYQALPDLGSGRVEVSS
jgi:hypothetical protein